MKKDRHIDIHVLYLKEEFYGSIYICCLKTDNVMDK